MPERLDPPSPTEPGDVIDAHTHLFTVGLLEEMLEQQPPEQQGGRSPIDIMRANAAKKGLKVRL